MQEQLFSASLTVCYLFGLSAFARLVSGRERALMPEGWLFIFGLAVLVTTVLALSRDRGFGSVMATSSWSRRWSKG